jgi:hypothetical protein
VSFRRSNTTYFETVSADPAIQTVSESPITRHSLKLLIVIKLQLSDGFMRKNAKSNNSKTKEESTQGPVFDTQVFLDSTGVTRKVKEFKKAEGYWAVHLIRLAVMLLC